MKKILKDFAPYLMIIALIFTATIVAFYERSMDQTAQQQKNLWNVYEDQDNGVTCYIYKDISISCLPTKDLKTNQ